MPRKEIRFEVVVQCTGTEADEEYMINYLVWAFKEKQRREYEEAHRHEDTAYRVALVKHERYKQKLMEKLKKKLEENWKEELNAALECNLDG